MTKLEVAVLKELSREHPEIGGLLGELTVAKREFSGVGSFTHFQPLANPIPGYPKFRRISLSKIVTFPELKNGLGGCLEVVNGSPDMLELYAYGSESWSGSEEQFGFQS